MAAIGRPLLDRRLSVDEDDSADSALLTVDLRQYVGAGGSDGIFITESDVDAINEFEGQPEETVAELLSTDPESGRRFALALHTVLKNITDIGVVKYALGMVEDLLISDLPTRAALFLDPAVEQTEAYDLTPFLRLLTHSSTFVREKACHITALFLSLDPGPVDTVNTFLTWTGEQLRGWKQDPSGTKAAATSLMVLLRHPTARVAFHRFGGVRLVTSLLRSSGGNQQLLYELSFCLWVMSFCEEAAGDFDHATLSELVSVVKSDPRDKVLRVVLAALRNVLSSEEKVQAVCEMLIERGLLKVCEGLATKGEAGMIKDPEVLKDGATLQELLAQNFRVLSTFERYRTQLLTNTLEWGPVHTDKFWRQNARMFEQDNFAAVKALVALLESEDWTTVAVACYDIGQFVRFYPNGKMIVEHWGTKLKVMDIMARSEDPVDEDAREAWMDVQKNALLCCSKMMVSNWEFLESSN